MTAYQRFTDALETKTGYRPASEHQRDWKCPVHKGGAESNPSLTVSPGDGTVLFHCHLGCSPDDVLSALELTKADIWDNPKSNGNGNGNHDNWTPSGEAIEYYPYRDESGALLYEVCRTADKQFPVRVPDPSKAKGWRWRLGDVRRVIYRLPQVLEAVAEGRVIFICEGERDVHALEAVGEVATTNPGGAGKWRDEYSQWFQGATVCVIADKDDVGRQHARKVAESLTGITSSVIIREAVEGKDAADHLAKGYTVNDFFRVDGEEVFANGPEPEPELPPLKRPITRTPLDITKRPEPLPMLNDYLYSGGFTSLSSEPGVGKTWIAIWLSINELARGGVVLYMDEEGGEHLMQERLYSLGATQEMMANFHYVYGEGRKWDSDDLEALEQYVTVTKPTLAIFDSLPDFLAAAGKSEDSAQDVTDFVNSVIILLKRSGAATLALDHLRKPDIGKSNDDPGRYARGSGAKLAKPDVAIMLQVQEAFDVNSSGMLKLWKTKDRYGRLPIPWMHQPKRLLSISVSPYGIKIVPSGVAPLSDVPSCEDQIADAIREFGPMNLSDLRKKVTGYRHEVVGHTVKAMDGTRIQSVLGPRKVLIYHLKDRDGFFEG